MATLHIWVWPRSQAGVACSFHNSCQAGRQPASQPASKKTSWARRSLLDRDYPKLCTFEPRLLYVLLAVLFGFFLLLFMTAIYSLVFHTPKFLWKRDEMTRRGGRIDTHNSMWQWLHSLLLRHLIDFGAPIHPQVYNNSRQTVQIGPQKNHVQRVQTEVLTHYLERQHFARRRRDETGCNKIMQ